MVRGHFQHYYNIAPADLRLVRIATDPDMFEECDRPRRRHESRERWGIRPEETVALFAGMNYRLKGLESLLRAVRLVPPGPFRLLVTGNNDTKRSSAWPCGWRSPSASALSASATTFSIATSLPISWYIPRFTIRVRMSCWKR